MSITHSTSDDYYTLIGNRPGAPLGEYPFFLTVVLLQRGGKMFFKERVEDLVDKKVDEIILVEHASARLNVEELVRTYPRLRCLLVPDSITVGEKINLAMDEAQGKRVLVQWTDMDWGAMPPQGRFWKELMNRNELALIPNLMSRFSEELPHIFVPLIDRRDLRILPQTSSEDAEQQSLFPFDFVGLYDPKQFKTTGGFDQTLANPYWQLVDWGVRSRLWGMIIAENRSLRLKYLSDVPSSENSSGFSYRRYYLKNLAIRFQGDSCELPRGRFLGFYFRSRIPFSKALEEFKQARAWVYENRFRFINDVRGMSELWGEDL